MGRESRGVGGNVSADASSEQVAAELGILVATVNRSVRRRADNRSQQEMARSV